MAASTIRVELSRSLNGLSTDIAALGEKGRGLSELPQAWIPEYVVGLAKLSAVAHTYTVQEVVDACEFSRELEKELSVLRRNAKSRLIIRSSAVKESIEQRGAFISREAGSPATIRLALAEILVQALRVPGFEDCDAFPFLAQTLITCKAKGHLANTRRVSRERREWLIETEGDDLQNPDASRIRVHAGSDDHTSVLVCHRVRDLPTILRKVAEHLTMTARRYHCEWVWDGETVFIVQADRETTEKKRKPGSIRVRGLGTVEPTDLELFTRIENAKSPWPKRECVMVFASLRLPTTQLYILDDANTIDLLARSKVPRALERDIATLLSAPIVVRTDTLEASRSGKFLLPRTDAYLSKSDVTKFLIDTASHWMNNGQDSGSIAFIAHRFLPATASAWSLAKPKHPSVRIDATYGLPDGLLYYSHDSYEVRGNGEILEKRIRCKERIIDFDERGAFVERLSGSPWDRKQTLSESELALIARQSIALAEYFNNEIETMFFIDVAPEAGGYEVLPWFYTFDVAIARPSVKTESHFNAAQVRIRNERDLEYFHDRAERAPGWAKRVGLALEPESRLLRDTEFLKRVAEIAQKHGCHVVLYGSVLSHTYYVLEREGVPVRAVEPLSERGERRTFNKLVRDSVPDSIRKQGEQARTFKAPTTRRRQYVLRKLIEEVMEVRSAQSEKETVEELADLVEVVSKLADLSGSSLDGVLSEMSRKRERRGGFSEDTVLIDTELSSVTTSMRDSREKRERLFEEEEYTQRVRSRPRQVKALVGESESDDLVMHLVVPYEVAIAAEVGEANVVSLQGGSVAEVRYFENRLEVLVWRGRSSRINPDQLALGEKD